MPCQMQPFRVGTWHCWHSGDFRYRWHRPAWDCDNNLMCRDNFVWETDWWHSGTPDKLHIGWVAEIRADSGDCFSHWWTSNQYNPDTTHRLFLRSSGVTVPWKMHRMISPHLHWLHKLSETTCLLFWFLFFLLIRKTPHHFFLSKFLSVEFNTLY